MEDEKLIDSNGKRQAGKSGYFDFMYNYAMRGKSLAKEIYGECRGEGMEEEKKIDLDEVLVHKNDRMNEEDYEKSDKWIYTQIEKKNAGEK